MGILTAGLTATGMDWLLRGHPSLKGRTTLQWWLLPTLTTFIISIALSILSAQQTWWIGFIIGGVIIFFVFLAEYIVVDADAPYYTLADGRADRHLLRTILYIIHSPALQRA